MNAEPHPGSGPARRFTDEVLDDKMAEVLRSKTPAERLQIGFKMWRFARDLVCANIRREHPEWDENEVRRQVATRTSGGALPPPDPDR